MTARSHSRKPAAFTLVEMLLAVAVFGIFMAGILRVWTSLSYTALNTAAYAARQNDQMRVLDYVKRDVRRATAVEIYNGGALVNGTTASGTELRLTIPDYYADTREEDNAIGTKTTNAPTVTAGAVSYGSPLTVGYSVIGGAVIRNEAGRARTVASSAGGFALSFKRESSGAIRCQVTFNQAMRGGTIRTLRRQVETICVPRFEFQL